MESLALTPKNQSLFVPGSSNGSSSDTSDDPITHLSVFNQFLAVLGVDFVKTSKKKFSCLQPRSQNVHISKASESIAAVLEIIAPGDAEALWKATKKSKLIENKLEIEKMDESEKIYLQALSETYKHATGWDTRRQVLSVMADLTPFSTLQKFLPGITQYRVKIARRHKDLYSRGVPLPSEDKLSTRMRVSPSQLDHFLSFITSPHVIQDLPFGERNLKLSNGEIIKTPNVIRMMVKQRTISQLIVCNRRHLG